MLDAQLTELADSGVVVLPQVLTAQELSRLHAAVDADIALRPVSALLFVGVVAGRRSP